MDYLLNYRLLDRELDGALYARLATIRAELYLVRTQLEAGRHGPRAKLLDQRFDAVQHRAADLRARLIEARAA